MHDIEFPDMFAFFHAPILLLIMISVAIGACFVARRVGRKPWLWVVLSLVPLVNIFFYIYAAFTVILYVLDRLNDLTRKEQRS